MIYRATFPIFVVPLNVKIVNSQIQNMMLNVLMFDIVNNFTGRKLHNKTLQNKNYAKNGKNIKSILKVKFSKIL